MASNDCRQKVSRLKSSLSSLIRFSLLPPRVHPCDQLGSRRHGGDQHPVGVARTLDQAPPPVGTVAPKPPVGVPALAGRVGREPRLLHPAPEAGRRARRRHGERDRRHHDPSHWRPCSACRSACSPGSSSPSTRRPARQGALLRRRPQRRALDRHRHLRLHARRLPMQRFSRLAGGIALGDLCCRSCAHHRGDGPPRPASLREASLALGVPAWRTTLASSADGARRDHHRRHAGGRARRRRDGAPALHGFGNRFWHTGSERPIASLPVQIYTYAISPFDDWQRQAWAGALVLMTLISLDQPRGAARDARPDRSAALTVDAWANTSRSRELDAWFGNLSVLQRRRPHDPPSARHRDHRPVRLRQVDLHPLPQPHARGRPRRARDRAGLLDGDDIYAPASTRCWYAARRHGVPAAEPVPDHVDLRQRGGRPAAQRVAAKRAARRGWSSERSGRPRCGTR